MYDISDKSVISDKCIVHGIYVPVNPLPGVETDVLPVDWLAGLLVGWFLAGCLPAPTFTGVLVGSIPGLPEKTSNAHIQLPRSGGTRKKHTLCGHIQLPRIGGIRENASMQLPRAGGTHKKCIHPATQGRRKKMPPRVNLPALKLIRNVESRYIPNFDHMVVTLGPQNAQGEGGSAQKRAGDAAQT